MARVGHLSQRKIFISCVNRELTSYRLKAEVVIQARGYRPIFEEVFRLDDQTALNTLKTAIANCDAVICLVGNAYGGELRNRPSDQPRRSFTQWEYCIAQELNKPIFRLATTPATPTDDQTAQPPPDPEPPGLRELQANFRNLVLDDHNFRTFANVDQLRAELALLRFPWQRDTPTHKPFELPFGSIGSLFKGREKVLPDLHHQLQSTASRTVIESRATLCSAAHKSGQGNGLWRSTNKGWPVLDVLDTNPFFGPTGQPFPASSTRSVERSARWA